MRCAILWASGLGRSVYMVWVFGFVVGRGSGGSLVSLGNSWVALDNPFGCLGTGRMVLLSCKVYVYGNRNTVFGVD